MATQSTSNNTAPRAVLLLPIAYVLHLAEEWFGGLSLWTMAVLGYELSLERFIIINAIAFPIFVTGALAAVYDSRIAWFGTSFAALLGLNGVLHTFGTLAYGRLMPGTITVLLIYIPLSVIVLRSAASRFSTIVLVRSIWLGVLLHGLVALLAFL